MDGAIQAGSPTGGTTSPAASLPAIRPSPTMATVAAATNHHVPLDGPQPGPLRAAGARQDAERRRRRRAAHHATSAAAPWNSTLSLVELEERLLQGLLDLGQVVQREPPRRAPGRRSRAALLPSTCASLSSMRRTSKPALRSRAAERVQVRRTDPDLPTAEPGQDLGSRRVGDQPPPADDHQPVGSLLHLAHQVARHQHRAALVGEPPQQVADPPHAVEVEAVDRLVEEHDPRVAQQCRGDTQPLAHAQRVALDPASRSPVEADLVDDLVDASVTDPVGAGRDPQVVASGPARVDRARDRAARPPRAAVRRTTRTAGRAPAHGRPWAGRGPSTIRIVVDFPAPLGPRKPVTSPCSTSKLRSSTATTSPYLFVSPRTSITAVFPSSEHVAPTLGARVVGSGGRAVEIV